ncbi:MAG: AMP-binding protein [Flavobacterium sp.]
MATISFNYIHPDFKLNNQSVNKENLFEIATVFLNSKEEHEKHLGEFLLTWFNDSEYIEMTTSGSTGTPKLIRIKKQAMVNSAIATGSFFDLKNGDKVLTCLPVKFVAGKMMLVRSFILGLNMDYVEPNSKPLKNNSTFYDFVAMIPLQVRNSLHELQNVKTLLIGGAKIDSDLEKELIPLSTQTFASYGMTETVSHVALRKMGQLNYKVLPNIQLSTDERGCLIIDAPMILEEKIITNDLVNLISDKEFIYLGRADNIVNSGGIKLFPEQIEEKIAPFIKNRFFVTGKPDAILGEKLILVIEGTKYKLPETVFENLGQYEKPKEIVFIDKFNETETGKIIRKNNL